MRAIARRAIVLVALISVVSLLASCASPAAMPTMAPAPTTAPAAKAYTDTSGAPSDPASQG